MAALKPSASSSPPSLSTSFTQTTSESPSTSTSSPSSSTSASLSPSTPPSPSLPASFPSSWSSPSALSPASIPSKSSSSGSNHTRVQNLVAGLAMNGIRVTEWGSLLYGRFDIPMTYGFDFLVDDDYLEAACTFTEEQGYRPLGNHPILLSTHGEYETIARHFDCFGQRVNLYPGSFAGFRANELCEVPLDLGYADSMPVSVFTTRPAPLAASLVRLISRVHRNDPMSSHVKCDLCLVLTYCLFDMSYEGDYMVLGEESQEDMDRAINRGLDLFRKWKDWRDDEMWIADALEAIIGGKGDYDHLPASSSEILSKIHETAEGAL